ncbi:MAG TPA: septum site-determining protein Ssd [Mycobacterium sp.]|nr:septum site-determining protein Ssd [Mycobacterium sp.]
MLTRASLRDEVERVGAAVGVRVVHAADSAPSRKTWSAAAAVILDEDAAARCGRGPLPRRAHVIVVSSAEPTGATWQAAISVGAQRVLTLPDDGNELVRELAEAGEAVRDDGRNTLSGEVIAVVGGRGGAGASLFAAALAHTAGDALLVDLDAWGGGIDLLIGSENTSGLRWPDLALQGGRLTWPAVREALPRLRSVSVLSGTRRGYEPDACAVDAVVDAGRRGGVTVVCDVPRVMTDVAETALDAADLVVVVSPCDVRACAASSAIAPRLRDVNPNLGVVVRGPSPGGLRAAEVADITGLPLLASMRAEPRLTEWLEHGGLRLPRRSALAAAARRVLDLLSSHRSTAAVQVLPA